MAFNLSKRPGVRVGILMNDYCDVARNLGIETATIRAVDAVESAGSGFLSDGRPKILCERHYFYRILKRDYGLKLAEEARRMDPGVCNPQTGGYSGGRAEYGRLARMTEICHKLGVTDGVALRSASWGRYQIMGDNYKRAGSKTIESFVEAMFTSELNHLKAFANYILNETLVDELRNLPKDPLKYAAAFASAYNGPAYRRNRYDEKIAAAYRKYSRTPVDCEQRSNNFPVQASSAVDRSEDAEGFMGSSLDDRFLTPGSTHTGSASVEITEGGAVKVTTDSSDTANKELIAIEKPAPVGFWKGLWQRIVAATGTNVGFEVIASHAERAGALGLSPETWTWIGWLVLAATVVALLGYIYTRRQEKKRDEEITRLLIEANSEEGNYVQLVDKDLLPLYEQKGYRIITR